MFLELNNRFHITLSCHSPKSFHRWQGRSYFYLMSKRRPPVRAWTLTLDTVQARLVACFPAHSRVEAGRRREGVTHIESWTTRRRSLSLSYTYFWGAPCTGCSNISWDLIGNPNSPHPRPTKLECLSNYNPCI